MPVPSAITDLSTTAASNSPAGSENVFPDLDNYLRAQASFVAQLYARRLAINIAEHPYNADGTSVANQTATIQSAIDACSAAGGGDVFIPNGTFYVVGLANKTNVALIGQSKSAVLKMFSTSGVRDMITVTGQSNCTFRNLTIDLSNATGVASAGSIAIRHSATAQAANNLRVDDVYFINNNPGTSFNAYIDSYCSFLSRGLFIENCNFDGKAAIRILPNVAPSAAPSSTACGNFIIRGNVCKNSVIFLQIRSGVRYDFDMMDSVVVSGNQVYSMPDYPTATDGSAAMELWSITDLTVTANTLYTGARGFSCNYCKAASFIGNSAYDQTSYFLELGSSDDVVITGNTAKDCKTFVNDTASNAAMGSKNVTISENVISGGNIGEVGYNDTVRGSAITLNSDGNFDSTITQVARSSNVATITTSASHRFIVGQQVVVAATTNTSFNGTVTVTTVPTTTTFTYANAGSNLSTTADTGAIAITATSGYQNWRIADNVFVGLKNTDTVFYIQGRFTNGVVIESNYVLQSDVTQQLRTVYITNDAGATNASNIFVRNNIILRTANITTGDINVGTYPAATTSRGVYIDVRPSTSTNIVVENNYISFTGTDSRGIGSIALGHTQGAGALANSRFVNNRIAGAFSGSGGSESVRATYTSTSFVYINNDVSGVTSGTETLNAATVYRRTKREFESAASPTSGTYIVGDRAWNSAPAVGQPKSWVCTVAGTPGTWVSEGNL